MPEVHHLLSFFKALADESRLRIVGVLASDEATVGEIAARLGLTEPTVSHHLRRLREAGLVAVRQEGNQRWYRLDVDALERTAKEVLSGTEGLAELAPERTDRRWEDKVLQTYFDGDKLTKIPASHKKRRVILEWLTDQFELDRTYPEREVNEILLRHHWDSATLRRELVGTDLMTRERGVYWRLR